MSAVGRKGDVMLEFCVYVGGLSCLLINKVDVGMRRI